MHDLELLLQQQSVPTADALAFFDSLDITSLEFMQGHWRGEGLPTGHVMDGFLEKYRWYGKRFDGTENVDPLVFSTPTGKQFIVNPATMPMALVSRYPKIKNWIPAGLFLVFRHFVTTKKPKARLRMTEHRGVVTATMIYDALPICDVFRKVDDDTVLGFMDYRAFSKPFFFVLRRDH